MTVAHLGWSFARIRWNRPVSGPVVVKPWRSAITGPGLFVPKPSNDVNEQAVGCLSWEVPWLREDAEDGSMPRAVDSLAAGGEVCRGFHRRSWSTIKRIPRVGFFFVPTRGMLGAAYRSGVRLRGECLSQRLPRTIRVPIYPR